MKGAVVESQGKIVVKELPDPVIGDYDVLCKTRAAGVCSGTDNHIVADHPYFKVEFPTILGHEGVGKVIACGNKVRYFQIGDMITRVFNKLPPESNYTLMYGAFAEMSIATDWQAMREDGISPDIWTPHTVHRVLPSHFDPVASTMLITWRETYSFLKRMNAQDKNTALIIGSGATALSFVNHARNKGLRTAIIGNPDRSEIFNRFGSSIIVSYHESHIKTLLNHEQIGPFDLIIDTVGKSDTLNKTIGLLKNKGKIGVYGLDSFFNYHINFSQSIGDFTCYNGQHYDEGSVHDEIMVYLKDGKLNAWDYLSKDHIYTLENIIDALDACATRKTIKSVIKFD